MKRSALLAIAAMFTAPAAFHAGTTAAGRGHSVVLTSEGRVWTWGDNSFGQLGDGSLDSRRGSAAVSGLQDIVAVAAGLDFTLALDAHGHVVAWGANGQGQLGDGVKADRSTPVEVSGLTDILAISAGTNHGLALKNDGSVWSWGNNTFGQLGDGTKTSRDTPVLVEGLTLMTLVGAGDHSLAVKADGTIWAWGRNHRGQLGDGTTRDSDRPVLVKGLLGPVAITGGAAHSLALLHDGSLWAWGGNDRGQIGDGTKRDRRTPVLVKVPAAQAISARGDYSLALSSGSVWGWGANDVVLGESPSVSAPLPEPITGLENIATIAAGVGHAVAVDNGGVIWTWGSDTGGQFYEVFGEASDASTAARLEGVAEDTHEAELAQAETQTRALRTPSTEAVEWTSLVNAELIGTQMTKVVGVHGWDGGGISTKGIASGDGYVEFVSEDNGAVVVGLSHGSIGQSFEEIQYGIYLNGYNVDTVRIRESGTLIGSALTYVEGDVFRVGVESGDIVYRQNGIEIHRNSTVSLAYPLQVDVSLHNWVHGFSGAVLSGELVTVTEDVVWTSVANAVASGNDLSKTTTWGWDAGGVSVQQIDGTNGYLDFTAGDIAAMAAGLSNGDSGYHFDDIDYAIFLKNSEVFIRESGVSPGLPDAGLVGTFLVGDRFRVGIESGLVVYRQNGVELHSHAIDPASLTYPLLVDASLNGPSTAVLNAVISDDPSVSVPVFEMPPGPYHEPVDVTIHADSGAVIWYTLDGSDPNGDDYEMNPGEFVEIAGPLTIKARASLPTAGQSNAAAADLRFQVGQVELLSFEGTWPPGWVVPGVTVALGAVTPGAIVRYEIGGGDPTETSDVFPGQLLLQQTTTIKIQGFKDDWIPSDIWGGTFTLTGPLNAPSFDPVPPAGPAPGPLTVTISAAPGATVAYTTDGTDPNWASNQSSVGVWPPPFPNPVELTETTTLKAIAFATGWATSTVAEATYTIQMAPPTLSPNGGPAPARVTVTTSPSDGRIHYVRWPADHPDPAPDPTQAEPSVPSGGIIAVGPDTILKVKAFKDGTTESVTVTANYTGGGAVTAAVVAGARHSMLLTPEGDVWAWGKNDKGQLGLGHYSTGYSPEHRDAAAGGLTGIVKVAAGDSHSAALAADGSLWMWGRVDSGQAPNPPPGNPAAVAGVTNALDVALGANHTLVLLGDGTVVAFGVNTRGQLGNAQTFGSTGVFIPLPVTDASGEPLADIVALAADGDHSLALRSDGSVWRWGADGYSVRAVAEEVPEVPGGVLYSGFAAGRAHALALDTNADVWAWGDGTDGALGNPTPSAEDPIPVPLGSVSALAGGGGFSLTVSSGVVHTFGRNTYGQLGDGTTDSRSAPEPITGPNGIVSVDAGESHALALSADGVLWAWGNNDSGQLGDGTTNPRATPVPISEPGFAWRTSTPYFTPGPGVYRLPKSIRVDSRTSGEVFCYTIDGSPPPEVCPNPKFDQFDVSLAETMTLKVIATHAPDVPSAIASGTYAFIEVTPEPGTYTGEQNVSVVLVDDVAPVVGLDLRYTTDGTEPKANDDLVPGVGIPVDKTLTLRVGGFIGNVSIGSALLGEYELRVDTPVLTQPGGTGDKVQAETTTPNAELHYTTTGGVPTLSDPVWPAGGVDVTASMTLRVAGWREGWTRSNIAIESFFVSAAALSSPTFAPGAGTYAQAESVTIRAQPGTTIRYTTDDSDPGMRSTIYTGPVSVGRNLTLKARAFRRGAAQSPVSAAAYTFDPSVVPAPSFSPGGGVYTTHKSVALDGGTAGDPIHYTTNGKEPTTDEPFVTSGGGEVVTVSNSQILKARVFGAAGESATSRADYRITGAVATGEFHTIALKGDGTLWSWGSNSHGQLGIGTINVPPNQLTPVAVSLPAPYVGDIVAVSVGLQFSLALGANGRVLSWGRNDHGQLGIGTTSAGVALPGEILILTDVVAISAGTIYGLALKSDGSVWGWGYNNQGQLGTGDTEPSNVPVQVGENNQSFIDDFIIAIAASAEYSGHNLALASDGRVWSWGLNDHGQLGSGSSVGLQLSPDVLPDLNGVVAIAVGQSFSLALQSDGATTGAIWGWGRNQAGELGDGTTDTPRLTPARGLDGVVEISVGSKHALAYRADRSSYAWGNNQFGNLGDGTQVDRHVPTRVFGLDELMSVRSTRQRTFAVKADGSVMAWGAQYLGNEYGGNYLTPISIGLQLLDNTWLTLDTDADGLSNASEYRVGTDPLNPDTNGDGVLDGVEFDLGGNPGDVDLDGDGLTNAEELALGTDPYNSDTDGDGWLDGQDAFPLDPNRHETGTGNNAPPDITLIEPANAEEL